MVVSDVHLGSKTCDVGSFNSFLHSLNDDRDLTDLVLLGDIVDMWRRDASGVFLESMETIQIIKDLKKRINVHYVAGNHDYHVLKLKNRAPHYHYPFEFTQTLHLTDGAHNYLFMHGYEFEYGRALKLIRPSMDILCRFNSDLDGIGEEKLWDSLRRKALDVHYTVFTQRLERRLRRSPRSLNDSPEERLKDKKLEVVERRAYELVRGKTNHVLIFGHTHHPFMRSWEDLVNTGSWVTESPVHNTYVVLENGRPRLFVYGGNEIMDRKEIA